MLQRRRLACVRGELLACLPGGGGFWCKCPAWANCAPSGAAKPGRCGHGWSPLRPPPARAGHRGRVTWARDGPKKGRGVTRGGAAPIHHHGVAAETAPLLPAPRECERAADYTPSPRVPPPPGSARRSRDGASPTSCRTRRHDTDSAFAARAWTSADERATPLPPPSPLAENAELRRRPSLRSACRTATQARASRMRFTK